MHNIRAMKNEKYTLDSDWLKLNKTSFLSLTKLLVYLGEALNVPTALQKVFA